MHRVARPTHPICRALLALLFSMSAAGCLDKVTGVAGSVHLGLLLVSDQFDAPLYLTAPPGDPRLFVVERGGLIKIVKDGQVLPTPFIDLTSQVTAGGERGLLGLAFDWRYDSSGYFYVDYTDADSAATHVVRYSVSSDPDVADQASALEILSVAQPYSNHNGGQLAFGPDGMLYIGLGDGGNGGDPQGNGQNKGTLLGSILRIDVDNGTPYAVPPENPFVGELGSRGEIWAYGLRNPWRFSFDRRSGDLYIADVGQSAEEEIDIESGFTFGGRNYGWNIMEGPDCYEPATGCDKTGLTLPVLDYSHGEGCSITGGYVYTGTQALALQGRYFFGDYCSGWIKSFVYANDRVVDLTDHTPDLGTVPNLSSFGEDAAGELYVLSLDGPVYQIVQL